MNHGLGNPPSAKTILAAVLVLALPGLALAAGPDFGSIIRPILSDRCFACHGPDEPHRQGGFRMDRAESATGEADSGERPIVPGDPDASEIIRRITSDDEYEVMPPPETHKTVSKEELELLRAWIAAGAEYEGHWSLEKPEKTLPPEKHAKSQQYKDWPRNAIDRFAYAKMTEKQFEPSPEAQRTTLLRRVTFDLTGLPPTPSEVSAFLADSEPGAYERVVDRLLRSTAYGEHMARHWLDAARYGDTHGLHLDNYREMWLYRDWVINAFNSGMAFDQFITEQLAGDLLPNPTDDQIIATGFNRCNVTTAEGGSIRSEVKMRNVVDRVDTFGTVFLGLTVGCSRCHDHKYDAITAKDYYSLYAFFNSLDADPMDGNKKDHPPVLRRPSHAQQVRLAELNHRIPELKAKLAAEWQVVDEAQAKWEIALRASQQDKLADKTKEDMTKKLAGSRYSDRPVLSEWHSAGPFSDDGKNVFTKEFGPEGKPIDLAKDRFANPFGGDFGWVRRSSWEDGQVNNEIPVRDQVASAFYLYRTITVSKPRKLRVSIGSDDAVKLYLNGKQVLAADKRRAAAPGQHKPNLNLKRGENQLLMKVVNYSGKSGFYFGLPDDLSTSPERVLRLTAKPHNERSDKENTELRDFFRSTSLEPVELVAVRKELTDLEAEQKEIEAAIPTTLVWKEAEKPVQSHILERGEYDQLGEPVGRATLEALPEMDPALPLNRLGLAQWLTKPEHPLTARVTVNRFWQQFFGTGLVKTADDFGSQGQPPTHPELLDWLAVDFREHGWNVRRLVRQIVISATYRQTSAAPPEDFVKDPENRYLARGTRMRLDAEMLRDQALAVSGLLVDEIGGPSVKPPQPKGLWKSVGYSNSNTANFKADKAPEKIHRRTLYTFMKRTSPPPQMSTFDAPSRESCNVRRERTNTPLQALLLLNDPQYFEAARSLAERTMRHASETPTEKAAYMFRLCTARDPSSTELDSLVAAYEEELAQYKLKPEAAMKIASITADGTLAEEIDYDKHQVPELASWTLVANVLLNLDEVVTRN